MRKGEDVICSSVPALIWGLAREGGLQCGRRGSLVGGVLWSCHSAVKSKLPEAIRPIPIMLLTTATPSRLAYSRHSINVCPVSDKSASLHPVAKSLRSDSPMYPCFSFSVGFRCGSWSDMRAVCAWGYQTKEVSEMLVLEKLGSSGSLRVESSFRGFWGDICWVHLGGWCTPPLHCLLSSKHTTCTPSTMEDATRKVRMAHTSQAALGIRACFLMYMMKMLLLIACSLEDSGGGHVGSFMRNVSGMEKAPKCMNHNIGEYFLLLMFFFGNFLTRNQAFWVRVGAKGPSVDWPVWIY